LRQSHGPGVSSRGGLSCDLIQSRIPAQRKHQNAAKIKNAAAKSVDRQDDEQHGILSRVK
jgi:hypothetical protein